MDPNAPVKKQRSPLFYVLIGCGGLMLLIFIGFMLVAAVLYKGAKDIAGGMTDPNQKAANVKKMLGDPPPGYHPMVTMSVPLFMDMALLGDKPMLADGGFPDDIDRQFMYFRVIATDQTTKAKDFFNGKDDDTSALRGSGINVDAKDILRRGALKTGAGGAVKYVATRGTMESNAGGQRGRGETIAGLNTLMSFECVGDTALRLGVWMMHDPNPGAGASELQLAGTVADEGEIAAFIKPLNPCK